MDVEQELFDLLREEINKSMIDQITPMRATTMQWLGDCWVVWLTKAALDDDFALLKGWIIENIAGWHQFDKENQSVGFDQKDDAMLFQLRFK